LPARGWLFIGFAWIPFLARGSGLNLAARTSAGERAFGADRTFFVTNGTSIANKIVVQSIITPGDAVLVDRNCHKAHHYALMLGGAQVTYLDSYPLDEYSMYGAVPLATITGCLRDYEASGRLWPARDRQRETEGSRPSPATRRRYRTSPGLPTDSGLTPRVPTATCETRTSWPTSPARVSTFPPRSWPLGSRRDERWCRQCSSHRTHRASRSSSPDRS
jgi:Orn/Lys/Arg decarboxylase, major domain